MGIDHMLMINRSGSKEMTSLLSSMHDCSVWEPAAGCPGHWQVHDLYTALIHRFCMDKWTLCVDSDELFVFPYMETRTLADLTRQLGDCDRSALWAVRIETYGALPLTRCEIGECQTRLFDSTGYLQSRGPHGQILVTGGLAERIRQLHHGLGAADAGEPREADQETRCPAAPGPPETERGERMPGGMMAGCLQRVPLTRPDPCFFYDYKNITLAKEELNQPHAWHPCPTGVLLGHAIDRHLLAEQQGHWMDRDLGRMLRDIVGRRPQTALECANSVMYLSSVDLIDSGLMADGGALRPYHRAVQPFHEGKTKHF